ncbi:MAG: diacylglycerol kinase family lipid kinase [Saprospiraceae bacterium]|nr:diacylglycerol kinase family lipid kinase [Saprospiraceae bacterium]
MKKRIKFVTNPFSGSKHGKNIRSLLEKHLDKKIYDFDISFTNYTGHAIEISRNAALSGYFAVVAVGGDGTINEVAQGLKNSATALAVIPFGSGNGFAYHLGIRRSAIRAIQLINSASTHWMDTGTANGKLFINVAGLGLDATVAYKTKLNSKRGFLPYFFNTLKESLGFKFLSLQISTGNKTWFDEYAMAVVANGSVYGYDFTVAPEANVNDGLFDIILVKKTHIFRYFFLVPRMLNKTLHKSPLVEYFKTSEITIENKTEGYFHVDGEGYVCEKNKIHFKVDPNSLLIIHNK